MNDKILKKLIDNKIIAPDLIERYFYAVSFIEKKFKQKEPLILDIGGRVNLLSGETISPISLFFRKTISLDTKFASGIKNFIQADACTLPFRDNGFDFVISLDVLEHIPPEKRVLFLSEVLRVTKDNFFLSFPYKEGCAKDFDKKLYDAYKILWDVEFRELKEHISNGLPKASEIMGFFYNKLSRENVLSFYGGNLNLNVNYYLLNILSQENPDINLKFEMNQDCLLNILHGFAKKSETIEQNYRVFILGDKKKTLSKEEVKKSLKEDFKREALGLLEFKRIIKELNWRRKLDFYLDSLKRKKITFMIFIEEEIPGEKDLRKFFNHLVTQKIPGYFTELIVFSYDENLIKSWRKEYPQVKFLIINEKFDFLEWIKTKTNSDYFFLSFSPLLVYRDSVKKLISILEKIKVNFVSFYLEDSIRKFKEISVESIEGKVAFFKKEFLYEIKSYKEKEFFLKNKKKIVLINNYNSYFFFINKRKKIAFVTHLFPPAKGGAEALTKNIADVLYEQGFSIKVITSNVYSTEAFFLNDKRRIPEDFDIGVRYEIKRLESSLLFKKFLNFLRSIFYRLYHYKIRTYIGDFLRIYSYGPRNRRFKKLILKEKPDIIFTSPFPMYNNLYGMQGAKRLKIPIIILPAFHIPDEYSFHNKVLFKVLREADYIVTLTIREKEFFVLNINIEENKIWLLPPCFEREDKKISEEAIKRFKEKKGLDLDKKIILYLGQHGIHKNIKAIFEAVKILKEKSEDFIFLIAGGITEYTEELKKMAFEINRGDKREIVKFVDNFPEEEKALIYSSADIFISLSEMESFGIVFIEAMSYGLPIIASKSSVANGIVENLKDGILINPRNPAEVAGAILELLEDKKVRILLGRSGQKKVAEIYNKKVFTIKWSSLINYAIDRHKERVF